MISKEEIIKIQEELQQYFPKAFPINDVVILKKGIHKSIFESGLIDISLTKLNKILGIYTRRYKYRKAHRAGAIRYDLEGNISGEVTEEEEFNTKANIAGSKKHTQQISCNKTKELPESLEQCEPSRTNIDDYSNKNTSKYSGTLKLNLSTK